MTGGKRMTSYVDVGSIKVAKNLYDFINDEALPNTKVDEQQFWQDFEKIFVDFTPRNTDLLNKRQELQDKISAWHKENTTFDANQYKNYLTDIGYLEEEVEDFKVDVENVDDEIARMGGLQLAIPINNPRYEINAANARWGSLYDALYGSDIISEENGQEKGSSYNEKRGSIVIEQGRQFLDESTPLESGSHSEAKFYSVVNNELQVS